MIELLIILGIIFAFVWAWLHHRKVESFDDFMELKWLFPSRNKRPKFDEISDVIMRRGVCQYKGQVRPWSQKVCKCRGYVYEKTKRGVSYCSCGDQVKDHRIIIPKALEDNDG